MIINIVNGNIYVGSTDNIDRRIQAHISKLARNKHHSIKLQRAWNKYGEDSFVFSEIERTRSTCGLLEREQHYIDALGAFGENGYNMLPTAGTTRGHKRKPFSKETLLKMSAAQVGRKHSQETKDKISRANSGLKRTAEQNARNSEARIGKKRSPESIAKSANAVRGRKMPPRPDWWSKKISEGLKGRKSENAKSVVVDGIEYRTRKEAMAALKCSYRKLKAIASAGF